MIGPTSHEHIGPAVGAVVTIGAAILGWAVEAIPVLQVISLIVAIIAGTITALWYWRQLRAHIVVASAILEAERLKASAKLVAAALDEHKKTKS